jgi:O-antigen ligase
MGLSVIFLLSAGLWERFSGWARVGESFGEPNALGGFFVMVFPFLLRFGWWWSSLFILFGIWLTQSRSALLAFGVEIIFYFKNLSYLRKSNLAKIFGVTICSGIIFLWLSWGRLRVSFEDNRVGLWRMGVKAALARPFLGYGADNIKGVLVKYAESSEIGMKGLNVDRAHSLALDLLLWSGVFGLICFSGLVLGMVLENLKNRERKDWNLMAVIAGFLTFSLFNPLNIMMWIIFYFTLGMLGDEKIKT